MKNSNLHIDPPEGYEDVRICPACRNLLTKGEAVSDWYEKSHEQFTEEVWVCSKHGIVDEPLTLEDTDGIWFDGFTMHFISNGKEFIL